MNIEQIATAACATVGIYDDQMIAVAEGFAVIRHQQIYEGFDWTASQEITSVSVDQGQSTVDLPDAERVISARWINSEGGSNFLDPVSDSYLFESFPELLVNEINPSWRTPKYYIARYNPDASIIQVGLAPAPPVSGTLALIIKKKWSISVNLLIPNIDEVLLAFVVSDLWEFLRQVGKAQAKRQEATTLLQAAQAKDTPAPPKGRQTKFLTTNGETLGEMTDSVCDIIGTWDVAVRESIKECIRREYETLWNFQLWPESLAVAAVRVNPDQQQVILPHFFDRVIEVATSSAGGVYSNNVTLQPNETSFFFEVDKDIFYRNTQPYSYTMLPSIATAATLPIVEQLRFYSADENDAGATIFVKGEVNGVIYHETVTLVSTRPHGVQGPDIPNPGPELRRPLPPQYYATGLTSRVYDNVLTLSKHKTFADIEVTGESSQRPVLTLTATESSRKHLRIWLLPNQAAFDRNHYNPNPSYVLVLGKINLIPLIDDQDTPQLRNVANALINAAAADMLFRLGKTDLANELKTKAAALLEVFRKSETEQNAHDEIIVPYVEPTCIDTTSIP